MKEMTWEDADMFIQEFLGYTIEDRQSNGKLYQISIRSSLPSGEEFKFTLQCEKDNPSSIRDAFKLLKDGYNTDEEAVRIYEKDKEYGCSLMDAVRDAGRMKEFLENDAIVTEQWINKYQAEADISKDTISKEFSAFLMNCAGNNAIEEKDAINICKKVVNLCIWEGGSPVDKKLLLKEYLKEIGINDTNPASYAAALNKIQTERILEKENSLEKYKQGELKTVLPLMSEEDKAIHSMFDTLFNHSYTNPVDYAEFVLAASDSALLNGHKGERFWKTSVDHAVNSGGALWQDSYERIKLFEKFGLIKNTYENSTLINSCYSTYKAYMKQYARPEDIVSPSEFAADIFTNKSEMTEILQKNETLLVKYRKFNDKKDDALIDKYLEKADKMYGSYMYRYLKDLNVLDNDKRDKKIAQYEKQHTRER